MRTLSIYHLHFKMKAVNSFILSFLTQLTIINIYLLLSHIVLRLKTTNSNNNKEKQTNLLDHCLDYREKKTPIKCGFIGLLTA